MSELKHTPVPWHVRDGEYEGEYAVCAPGATVAVLGARPGEECAANAEFIVRAVNAHDALLAACREALDGILQMGSDWSDRMVAILTAAIAKTKGRTGAPA